MLRVYPTVKHWFIKSTQEKIDEIITKNHEAFKKIDQTLVKI